MARLGEMLICNPTVKIDKEEEVTCIEMEKIIPGTKYVTGDICTYTGQGGAKFENGDTLMARITPCLENGKIAKCFIKNKGFGSTEYFVFRGKKGITDNDYVYYLMKTPYVRQLAVNSMTGASGRQRADMGFIKRIKWNFPTYEKQIEIANKLSLFDDLIRVNERKIELLSDLSSALFKKWFLKFEFPGHENYSFEKKSPKGWILNGKNEWEIPKNWKYGCLSEIGIFKRGKNITTAEVSEGEVPVIAAGKEPSCYHSEYNVEGPCLTISASGANAGYLQYHMSNIWASDCSFYCDQNSLWYVYNMLKYLQPVISNLQIGSAQPHVYAKDVNNLSVLVPEEKYIRLFNDQAKIIYEEISHLLKLNHELEKERDLLLPYLITGDLIK